MKTNKNNSKHKKTKNLSTPTKQCIVTSDVSKRKQKKVRQKLLKNKIKNNPSTENSENQIELLSKDKLPSISLYVLAEHYKNQFGNPKDIDSFINFCKNNFDTDNIETLAYSTTNQAKNSEWHDMRYGRITASSIYDAAHCHTLHGSTFRQIMGQVKYNQRSVHEGHILEERVLKIVEDKYNLKISRVGICLNEDYPLFGASPDGLTPEYCIEIKCPRSEKTYQNYVNYRNQIPTKIMAQIQLQMLFCYRKKALLCLADPNFMRNNNVYILEIDFDEAFIKDLIDRAQYYWEHAIFPVLMKRW